MREKEKRSGRVRETESNCESSLLSRRPVAGAAAARENSPKAGEFRIDDGGSGCDDTRQTDGRRANGRGVSRQPHARAAAMTEKGRKRVSLRFRGGWRRYLSDPGAGADKMRDGSRAAIERPLILSQSLTKATRQLD